MEHLTGAARLALVLSGGNALGAYQAGAYAALHEAGIGPDWITGASAGSLNAAVIAGNPPDRRIARLRALWGAEAPEAEAVAGWPDWPGLEEGRRTLSALSALMSGRPGLFVPRHLYGPGWNPLGNDEPASLYDATPLEETLASLADFERLNSGDPRVSLTAIDVETGEDVMFDSARDPLTPGHFRASCALLPGFSPVRIGDRLLGDAGLSVNLPLDLVLAQADKRPLLCIAVDLLPLEGHWPRTLGEMTCRTQDLLFATQSRRAIAAWQAIFDERARSGTAPPVTLVHVAYEDQQQEVSGKAFDFSSRSAAGRWRAGQADMAAVIALLREQPATEPGLRHLRYRKTAEGAGELQPVRWPVGPVPG